MNNKIDQGRQKLSDDFNLRDIIQLVKASSIEGKYKDAQDHYYKVEVLGDHIKFLSDHKPCSTGTISNNTGTVDFKHWLHVIHLPASDWKKAEKILTGTKAVGNPNNQTRAWALKFRDFTFT